MTQYQGATLSDSKGAQRIRKLQERSRHIDDQIAELQDKKEIIEYEIRQIRKEMQPVVTRNYCDPCERTEPECGECQGRECLR